MSCQSNALANLNSTDDLPLRVNTLIGVGWRAKRRRRHAGERKGLAPRMREHCQSLTSERQANMVAVLQDE